MSKYEAVVSLTVEVNASSPKEADQLFLGELTNRVLEIAKRDNIFKLWLDVVEINELEEN